ncbi:metacaspase MCA3, putative [Trypanosoma vivax Y486]|uniref:Metacaspase MCA3, putative n=1 Tax=Trypanosoma vivax (strain Y486) TaxID=1055687 RepID=F9WNV6_TRYVY|nr:metacaspase MCA3, putative [Trypanosoma vivax Y486]|eukprot:CCD19227.1 metacaspase MCA3, putative [Trypanosoma vivax Y486]
MGFDPQCLISICNVLMTARSQKGAVNFIDVATSLLKIAGPYIVQYLGEVPRPQEVNVDDALSDAESAQGFKPWESSEPVSGEVRALFIGINYYGTSAKLSGCCNDVRQMIGTLQRRKFPITSMNILVDEDDFPGRTDQPTRANILRYMAWLVKDAKPGDVLFLHFSGHGTQTKAANDSEEEFDQCIAPVDFKQNGCILDDDIYNLLLSRLPEGVRFTAVFDCCHSGSMMDLPFTYVCRSSEHRSSAGHMKRIRQGNDVKADVLMISGCEDKQTSADVQNTATFGTGSTGAGGAATQCLTIMMLKETSLSYRDVLLATRDKLKQKRFTQVPQMSASKPIDLNQKFSLKEKFLTDHSVA